MKVLLFHPWEYNGEVGGTDIYVKALISILKKGNIEVAMVCDGNHTATITINEIKVYKIHNLYPTNYRLSEGVDISQAYHKFQQIIAIEQPSIIHFHCFGKWQLHYLMFALNFKIKVAITPHLSSLTCGVTSLVEFNKNSCNGIIDVNKCANCIIHYRYKNFFIASAIKLASKLLTVKDKNLKSDLLARFQVYGNVARTKKMMQTLGNSNIQFLVLSNWYKKSLIENGIKAAHIDLIEHEIKYSIIREYKLTKPLKLYFSGRQNVEKGLVLLLETLVYINDKNIELHICGPIVNSFKAKINDLSRQLVSSGVTVVQHGLIEHKKAIELLQTMHVCCFPSIDSEMRPLVIIEAQSLGIPVIAANHTGIADLIDDNVNGFLFERASKNSLAFKIKSILNNKDLLLLIHKNLVKQSFNHSKNNIIELYKNMLFN
jgi:glycosyltransferase involved in cell wall biosynthesis